MNDILAGMMSVCTPTALLLMAGGVVLGIVFGALPGLSATTGIALCLPITYRLGPIDAIALLIGIYVGGISGALISAILLEEKQGAYIVTDSVTSDGLSSFIAAHGGVHHR